MITLLGEYPSLAIGPLLDNHQTDIGAVMRESLETEAVDESAGGEESEEAIPEAQHAGEAEPLRETPQRI